MRLHSAIYGVDLMKNVLRMMVVLLLLPVLSNAVAAQQLQILPTPTADRTFQFVHTSTSFLGTPLAVEAVVPYALIVIGADESPELATQAATMAYMIGQWSQEPGTSLEMIKKNQNLGPLVLDKSLTQAEIKNRHLVVVGKRNTLYAKLEGRLRGKGSFIEVIKDGLVSGRDIMFVSDEKAAYYLANKRLYFKSGAYKGFFSFAKTRLLIEKDNFAAALFALDDPEAVRGCGKPVILAIGHKENIPPEMMRVAGERNKLVFKDLRAALKAGDRGKAIEVWQAAMGKCYGCHQGRQGIKQYRKFKPNKDEHAYHGVIAQQFGANCSTCHYGSTAMVGYK